MIRARAHLVGVAAPGGAAVYSSISRTYGLPSTVNGSAFWGIDARLPGQPADLARLRVSLRAWISLVSRTTI